MANKVKMRDKITGKKMREKTRAVFSVCVKDKEL